MSLDRVTCPHHRRRAPLVAQVAVGVMLGTVVALGTAGATAAADGIKLLGGITDPGNVLSGCRSDVLAAEKSLFDKTGSNLFVVLVPDVATADLSGFVDQTWDGNAQLTPSDILFVGTTDEVHAQILQGKEVDASVTQNEQDAITEAMRTPALAGDWCAATLAVAAGYEAAIPQPATPSGGGGGAGIPSWLIVRR